MVMILKRERNAQTLPIEHVKAFFTRNAVVFGIVGVLGVGALAAGVMNALPVKRSATPPVVLPKAPAHRDGQAEATAQTKMLQEQGDRIYAALLAFEKELGYAYESQRPQIAPDQTKPKKIRNASEGVDLSNLSPGFIPSESGAPPAYLSDWRLVDGTIYRKGVAKETCQRIVGGPSVPVTHIDYGKAGLWCFEHDGQYVATYRLHAGPGMAPAPLRLAIEGKYDQGLTTWRVNLVEDTQDCPPQEAHLKDYVQNIRLSEANSSFETTLCVPAYVAELAALNEGLSFIQGSDVLSINGWAQEQAWDLQIQAKSCGQGSASQASIWFDLGSDRGLKKTSSISCD